LGEKPNQRLITTSLTFAWRMPFIARTTSLPGQKVL
jgi:hypothetical protein